MSPGKSLTIALALAGWGAALALGRLLRARMEVLARAEHELRGPATAMLLACERLAGDPVAARHAAAFAVQLDRLIAGFADLAEARGARPPAAGSNVVELREYARSTLAAWDGSVRASLDWGAGPVPIEGDRGRLAQALGNVIANAAEHGAGEVSVRARRRKGVVRVEVANANRTSAGTAPSRQGRGRGLDIAARAARDLGGRLLVDGDQQATLAVLELPSRDGAAAADGVDAEAPARDRAA